MNKKRHMLVISLVLLLFLCISNVSAENTTSDNNILQENNDIPTLDESNNYVTQTSSQHTITAGSDSDTIQNTINSMKDGDVLNFEKELTKIFVFM